MFLRSIAGAIRNRAGRNVIEPHLAESLKARNQCLRDLFYYKKVMMKEKPKKVKAGGKKDGVDTDTKKVATKKAATRTAATKKAATKKAGTGDAGTGDAGTGDAGTGDAGTGVKEVLDENGYRDIIRIGVCQKIFITFEKYFIISGFLQ